MRRFEQMDWNDEIMGKVRALYKSGKSMRLIADALGVTKSMISGKIARLREAGDPDFDFRMPTDRTRNRLYKPLPPVSPKRLEEIAAIPDSKIDTTDIPEVTEEFFKKAKLVKPKPKPLIEDDDKPAIAPAPPLHKPTLMPQAKRLTILQVNNQTCRWPVTDEHPIMACGAPTMTGSSYCAFHACVSVRGGLAAERMIKELRERRSHLMARPQPLSRSEANELRTMIDLYGRLLMEEPEHV
jgi:GcrA cell cycle regulator